jgi:hypothetical protein
MNSNLTADEQRTLRRIAEDPFFWVRKLVPEAREWEDELYDLIDRIKAIWEECRIYRVNLCFALKIDIVACPTATSSIHDFEDLQKRQNLSGSTIIFEIDLNGSVIEEIHLQQEVEPASVMVLSKERQSVFFWLGPDLEFFFKGYRWDPTRSRSEILKDIKSKRRTYLLSMEDYRGVLNTHYERCIRGGASVEYWFSGKKNQILRDKPERIFQKSLLDFLNREVDCLLADPEPMFRDSSRCDVRVFLENFDLYFIEVKWIGYSARRLKNKAVVTAEDPFEFGVDRAIDGAYQTKLYIERNNAIEFDHRIRLGIYLVYDAYPEPAIPIDYGQEIMSFPLLVPVEYPLATDSPSVETRGIAKRKGLV